MPISQVCLPEDDSGIHYGAFIPQRGHPIAVISLFLEDIPIDKEDRAQSMQSAQNGQGQAIRFRKFACDPQFQGKGVGMQLLYHSLSMARSELGVGVAWCDARATALGWYRKRGFIPFGMKFYKGPVEYIRIRMDLKDLQTDTSAASNCDSSAS